MKKLLCLLLVLSFSVGVVYSADDDTDAAKEKVISEIGTLVNSQKYQSALMKCDNAIKKYPDEAFLYYWKGTIMSSLNEKNAALENFNKSIELNSNNSRTYVMRGICKSDLGDKEGALEDYNKAIELSPKDGSAYSMRAVVRLELGDFSGADSDLDMSHKLMNSKKEE